MLMMTNFFIGYRKFEGQSKSSNFNRLSIISVVSEFSNNKKTPFLN